MARGTATNRLTDVIQVIQIAHKTGMLQVNRDGSNKSIEQGTIYLQNGQIVDASLGPYQGIEALRHLETWQTCFFVFQPTSHLDGPSSAQIPPNPIMSYNGHGSSPTLPAYDSSSPTQPTFTGGNAPERLRDVNEMLPYFNRLGLSRMHKQLFLLVDGQRTVPELTRLIGHRTETVTTMLTDLERAGLIRYSS